MTSRMINTLCKWIFIFYNVQRVSSASIDISNFQCDEGYPMDVLAYKFSCNGGSQCSFGDYAAFEGQCKCIHVMHVCVLFYLTKILSLNLKIII